MKLYFGYSFIFLLVLSSSFLELTVAIVPTVAPAPASGICDTKCGVRCSLSWMRKECMRLCKICCGKCNYCVPSGPRADKAECPCYRDMVNQHGKPKCP